MFKKRRGTQSGIEPHTPKLPSVALPDIYSPSYSPEYEKPKKTTFMRRFFSDRRSVTPSSTSTPSPVSHHHNHRHNHPPSSYSSYYANGKSNQPATRPRTASLPYHQVEASPPTAPRPIRPHPSQGPPIPTLEGAGPRVRTDSSVSYRGPVGVPSAAYLEKHVTKNKQSKAMAPKSILKRDNSQTRSTPPDHDANWKANLAVMGVTNPIAEYSKAYVEALGDQQRTRKVSGLKHGPSYENFEPVPVEDPTSMCHDSIGKELTKGAPLPLDSNGVPKPALKKVSSIRPPTVQPLVDERLGWIPPVIDDRAAWSEDEATFNKKRNSRPSRHGSISSGLRHEHGQQPQQQQYHHQQTTSMALTVTNPATGAMTPATTDDERRRHRHGGGKPSRGYSDSLIQTPHSAALPSRSSTSSSSPADLVVFPQSQQNHAHQRRATVSDPRSAASNYMPAYVKGQDSHRPPQQPSPFTPAPQSQPQFQPPPQPQAPRRTTSISKSTYTSPYHHHPGPDQHISQTHPLPLAWPLIDFNTRKFHAAYPMIYFDAGFDPKIERFPIKVKRGPMFGAMTDTEKAIPAFVTSPSTPSPSEMVIICRKLDRWPVFVRRKSSSITVFDIFEKIYRTYAAALTPEEAAALGSEYLQRCLPHYKQRCVDGPELVHLAERKGILRIDVLRGKRIFKGLVPWPGKPGVWELLFDEGN